MTIALQHYIILATVLFALGVLGIFINRKSLLHLLMCLELSLLGINLALIAFGTAMGDIKGQVMSLFVLTIAAAEVAVGLALLAAFFRLTNAIHMDDITLHAQSDKENES